MGSSDADVVQSAGQAQGDAAVVVDTVGADSVVAVEALPGVALGRAV